MKTLIPMALGRRLLLALWGYRCVHGVWIGPGPWLIEEQIDTMSPALWGRLVRRWATSAAMN